MKQHDNESYQEPHDLPGIEDAIRTPAFDDPRIVAKEMWEDELEQREDMVKGREYQPAAAELGSLGLAAAIAAEEQKQNSAQSD